MRVAVMFVVGWVSTLVLKGVLAYEAPRAHGCPVDIDAELTEDWEIVAYAREPAPGEWSSEMWATDCFPPGGPNRRYKEVATRWRDLPDGVTLPPIVALGRALGPTAPLELDDHYDVVWIRTP